MRAIERVFASHLSIHYLYTVCLSPIDSGIDVLQRFIPRGIDKARRKPWRIQRTRTKQEESVYACMQEKDRERKREKEGESIDGLASRIKRGIPPR